MLIFDRFPTKEKAQEFGDEFKRRFGLEFHVCETDEQARQFDVFPFAVDPIIVMMERPISKANTDDEWDLAIATENFVVKRVAQYGGSFAGT